MADPASAHLKKDLRIMRILWGPMVFSFAVFLLVFMENNWVYLAAGIGLAFAAAATVLGLDDRFRAGPLLAALPGTRRDIIAGRYLSWGVVVAAGAAVFLVLTVLFHAGFGGRAARLLSLVSVKGAAVFLAGSLLAGLTFLPVYFRLGFWRGIWSFLGAGCLLSLTALDLAGRLAPSAACPLLSGSPVPGAFIPAARGFLAFAGLVDRHMERPEVLAGLAALLVVMTGLSFRLSAAFYQKRDL
jgi:hypothetical protein